MESKEMGTARGVFASTLEQVDVVEVLQEESENREELRPGASTYAQKIQRQGRDPLPALWIKNSKRLIPRKHRTGAIDCPSADRSAGNARASPQARGAGCHHLPRRRQSGIFLGRLKNRQVARREPGAKEARLARNARLQLDRRVIYTPPPLSASGSFAGARKPLGVKRISWIGVVLGPVLARSKQKSSNLREWRSSV